MKIKTANNAIRFVLERTNKTNWYK